ncbi:MAG: hypothetical protein AB1815_01110 [Bacillota bacterium]
MIKRYYCNSDHYAFQMLPTRKGTDTCLSPCLVPFITGLNRPKTPASAGGGFQRAVKSSMNSANIQRGLNPPLNEVSFNERSGP